MSYSHPSCLQLPPPGGIRLDIDRYLSQYYIYRSFQINWSTHLLTHTPVFRPWGSLAAEDHYFEWRNKAEPRAFISILFVITPALDLSEQRIQLYLKELPTTSSITPSHPNYLLILFVGLTTSLITKVLTPSSSSILYRLFLTHTTPL
jgi:hypothetical protein